MPCECPVGELRFCHRETPTSAQAGCWSLIYRDGNPDTALLPAPTPTFISGAVA